MFQVPELGYAYDALERSISAEIMTLHHDKHHQTYVDKLNAALEDESAPQALSIEQLITRVDELPASLQTSVRNNGGGHYNHSLFWRVMSPNGGGTPTGRLANDIVQKYGSFQAFVDTFTEASLGVFGSGWTSLLADLEITTSQNQDSPLMTGQGAPLLGLDVWEHAYYLDYKNKRNNYIASWWDVVDWQFVGSRYKLP